MEESNLVVKKRSYQSAFCLDVLWAKTGGIPESHRDTAERGCVPMLRGPARSARPLFKVISIVAGVDPYPAAWLQSQDLRDVAIEKVLVV